MSQPSGPSLICIDRMFEGGPPESKGMSCHLVIEYWVYLSWILMDMDWWGDLVERVGLICDLVPQISFGCYSSILVPWDLLYWPFGSRVVLLGKPRRWLCGLAPLFAYITPFPLTITPFIIFPAWVHIASLGPHRVSLPIPLPQPWVKPRTMPWRLKQLKEKVKS